MMPIMLLKTFITGIEYLRKSDEIRKVDWGLWLGSVRHGTLVLSSHGSW